MNQLEFYKNELQMDYFSDHYRNFENDFYRYSALDTPLTFLTDVILLTMVKSSKNYFKLNKENAKDNRDYYFIFDVEFINDHKSIKKYIYKKQHLDNHSIQKRNSFLSNIRLFLFYFILHYFGSFNVKFASLQTNTFAPKGFKMASSNNRRPSCDLVILFEFVTKR